jgi:RAT1-interacting protein
VGFRTQQGRITTLQTLETLSLPRMVRGKPGAWDPKPCLAFAEKLLGFIRSTLETERRRDQENSNNIPPTTSSMNVSELEGKGERLNSSDKFSRVVWRLEIRPNAQNVVLYKLEPSEVEEVRNGEERVGFLPTWFWESVTRANV